MTSRPTSLFAAAALIAAVAALSACNKNDNMPPAGSTATPSPAPTPAPTMSPTPSMPASSASAP